MQVETYLQTEGALVRFWYPLEQLEKPPHGQRKASRLGAPTVDIGSIHLHRLVQSRATVEIQISGLIHIWVKFSLMNWSNPCKTRDFSQLMIVVLMTENSVLPHFGQHWCHQEVLSFTVSVKTLTSVAFTEMHLHCI